MADSDPGNLNILNWAEDDRPREKLLKKGKAALSDAELIAILLGSGTRSLSAVELAKLILKEVGHNLHDLAKLSVTDLMKFKGVGEAKAISIVSALEIGRRRTEAPVPKRAELTTALQFYRYLKAFMLDLPHEEFWVVALNSASQVIHRERISTGGLNRTLVDAKMVFKVALDHRATQLLVAHNHPSGETKPSRQDKVLTENLTKIGNMLDLPVVDHLIFADNEYFSFRDEGYI
ncbi:MAG TPA: hypothetical protein DCE41_02715 [Cytophagales bacterium]|nr:hypothetical protein [Cytophagales bacterium]HAP60620.1 hypothetical protein [Cytophagales bacterium]